MNFAHVSRRFTLQAQEHSVPGAQLAIHQGGETWTCEFGEELHGSGRLVTRESKVPIGSISKTFTATLAMILVSDGDLELDAPLVEYLPELRAVDGDLSTELTLRHLLSHTGGLPSDAQDLEDASLRRYALDCCRRIDPLHRPGAAFSYSNIGYVLAGHLIEVVTGMSWWEAVEAVLLKPLRLVPHFVVGTGERRPFVSGHAVHPGLHRVRPVAQSLTSVKAPAGALAASALDLITLGRLLASGEPAGLIDPVALTEMRRPVPHGVPFGLADGWGLGLALFRDGATTWLGHDGNSDGTACHLRFDPAGGTVVALTTNGNSGFGMWLDLVQDLRVAGCPVGDYDRLRGLQRRRSPPPNCTGSYVNGDIEYTVQPARDGTLLLTVDGEPFAELTPHEGLIFAMRDVDTDENNQMGRFLPDPHGDGIGWIQIGGRLARRKSHAWVRS